MTQYSMGSDARGVLRALPRTALDKIAKDIGIPNPYLANKVDVVNMIDARATIRIDVTPKDTVS